MWTVFHDGGLSVVAGLARRLCGSQESDFASRSAPLFPQTSADVATTFQSRRHCTGWWKEVAARMGRENRA